MKTLLGLGALALAFVPAADAKKFRVSLTVQPAHVWVKQPARVIVRTSIVLPASHVLPLNVVGPWHPRHGNAFFEPRLRRTGPKTFTASVRFPYGGRWRLIVPNWIATGSASPPPGSHELRVQPSP
jgi:hypothetical protein